MRVCYRDEEDDIFIDLISGCIGSSGEPKEVIECLFVVRVCNGIF